MTQYFAYGADLDADQMTRRCPDATDPRPATLPDHDWLINARGVATVEPFAGSEVHGVLWRISGRDLAGLDRHRLTRLQHTVHTDDGPADAYLLVDHTTEPGAPPPGYLERVIGDAQRHGLPAQWLDFLRRWDPVHWPRQFSAADTPGPRSLSELLADPAVTETSVLRSRFGFLAIHGGGLEKMTDVLADRAAAAADASIYQVRHPPGYPHHLASKAFVAEQSTTLAAFLDHVDVVVSLHGYGRIGRSTQLLAGGRNRSLATHLAEHVKVPGYQVVTDLDAIPRELRGLHPDKPVNRPRRGGAQLELTPRVRGISPRSGPGQRDGLTRAASALVDGLAAAALSYRSSE